MFWKPQITVVARAAYKKLGVLFRVWDFFPLLSYSTYTRVSSALVWSTALISVGSGGSGFIRLLDRVESKAKRLINCPVLSSSLDPLYLRRDIGALSLFYRYCRGKCSRELSTRVPPPLRRPRSTRGAVSAHEFCVDVSNSRLVHCGASFFPATSVLWNSLPSSVFPTQFNFPHFKACVCAHLGNLR